MMENTKKSRTRKRIIDAALDEFSEKGIAAASLEHIAERSEVARRTIYYHFSDKNELLRSIVDDRLVLALADIRTIQGSDTGINGLAEFCLDFWQKDARLILLLRKIREEQITGFSNQHDSFLTEFGQLFNQPGIKNQLRFHDAAINLRLIFFSLFPLLEIISGNRDYKKHFIDIFLHTLTSE